MNRKSWSTAWAGLTAASLLALSLASCGGGSGDNSAAAVTPPPVSGIATGATALQAASSLSITVTAARVTGRPEIDFTVTDEASHGMTGLVGADLRFNIAKLVPGAGGGPADWQNYINRVRDGAVQGHQERTGTGNVFGTLVGHGGGAYTYTFATDITDPLANPCPAPCTTAEGKALDLRFEPGLTHRITVQQANATYPEATGVLDFLPTGSRVVTLRDVVTTATCNTCHATLTAHGTRTDTKLCVTCHNPGTWVAGAAGAANTTVDFKVMVHRIHYNNAGQALPSVLAGGSYKIGAADFSAVTFPQDARNCSRCHDSSPAGPSTLATAQGDHWKTEPSQAACGSCHDTVYFGTTPPPTQPLQTRPHSGGVMTDDSTCASCHAAGRFTDSKDIVVAHDLPNRLTRAAARFEYRVLSATPTTPGGAPVITFSVTDPTRGDAPWDIKTAPAFTAGANSTLTVKIGWTTLDFNNAGSGEPFGQPVSINALTAATPGASAGTYTVTSPVAIPAGQTGTLRVLIDGHPAGDVSTAASFTDRLATKSVFRDFAITGALTPRRSVVEIDKCNVCHASLSLHGNNRSNEIGVCTVCHNPDATDAARRPVGGGVDGLAEQSIDFKTMIHGIHAGQADKGGMRDKGLTIYGFGGSVNDFSGVVFPGRLSDCTTCHTPTSYRIVGIWATPQANGIGGSTVSSGASSTDPADNLRMSPTAAVCLSCHDRLNARLHMQDTFLGAVLSATQADLVASGGENCAFCHGDGRLYDVKTMHGVQ